MTGKLVSDELSEHGERWLQDNVLRRKAWRTKVRPLLPDETSDLPAGVPIWL